MESPRPNTKKSQATEVSSSKPVKKHAGTQFEANPNLHASQASQDEESKSSPAPKHSITDSFDIDNSILKETDNSNRDDLLTKQRTLTKMTPSSTSRVAEDVSGTTEDSLNKNITAFVSTRYSGCKHGLVARRRLSLFQTG